jgi:hypothetical protein
MGTEGPATYGAQPIGSMLRPEHLKRAREEVAAGRPAGGEAAARQSGRTAGMALRAPVNGIRQRTT